MCIEDVKIGRAIASRSAFFATSPQGTVIFPADPKRFSVTISTGGTAKVFIKPSTIPVDSAGGFTLTTQVPTITLTRETVGSVLNQSWTADDAAAGVTILVIDNWFDGLPGKPL